MNIFEQRRRRLCRENHSIVTNRISISRNILRRTKQMYVFDHSFDFHDHQGRLSSPWRFITAYFPNSWKIRAYKFDKIWILFLNFLYVFQSQICLIFLIYFYEYHANGLLFLKTGCSVKKIKKIKTWLFVIFLWQKP